MYPSPIFDSREFKIVKNSTIFDADYKYDEYVRTESKRKLAMEVAEFILSNGDFCKEGFPIGFERKYQIDVECYVLTKKQLEEFAIAQYEKGKNART